MKKFTVGFVFDQNLKNVLLMHKDRPDWQAGKVNGIGGKFDVGEESLDCMMREAKEESDLDTDKDKWVFLGNMYTDMVHLDVYAYVHDDLSRAKTMTSEEVEIFSVANLPSNMLSNLRWLIPMAVDKIENQEFEPFKIKMKEKYR
jgi:8-oxo-dGTP diphosphatase